MRGRLGIGVRRAKPPGTLRYNHSGRYYTGKRNCRQRDLESRTSFRLPLEEINTVFPLVRKTDGLDNNLVTFDRLFAYVIHRGVAAELNRSVDLQVSSSDILVRRRLTIPGRDHPKANRVVHPVPGWRKALHQTDCESGYKAGFLAQRRFLISYAAPVCDSRRGVWLRIANPTPHSQWDRPAGSGLAGPGPRGRISGATSYYPLRHAGRPDPVSNSVAIKPGQPERVNLVSLAL